MWQEWCLGIKWDKKGGIKILSNEDFVRQSLDLNLFFLRIMKEHSFFLEAGFTPVNADLARQADAFKNQFETLLKEVVVIAHGFISPDVASSGEIVTGFTLNAERATTFLPGFNLTPALPWQSLTRVNNQTYKRWYNGLLI